MDINKMISKTKMDKVKKDWIFNLARHEVFQEINILLDSMTIESMIYHQEWWMNLNQLKEALRKLENGRNNTDRTKTKHKIN